MYRSSIIAALVFVAAASAHAQGNKVVRSGAYYEDRALYTVSSANLTLTFAQTPTDKFLNVTDVACIGRGPVGATLQFAEFSIGTNSGTTDTGRRFGVSGSAYTSSTAASQYFSINTKTSIKVGPGRYPSILIVLNTAANMYTNANCTIVGTLSDD